MTDEAGGSENPVEAAAEAARLKAAAHKTSDRAHAQRWATAGVGAAIGSAAVVAAMLYMNRNKKRGGGD